MSRAHGKRSPSSAIGAAWLAFMVGVLAGGGARDPGSFALAAAIGAAFVLAGFSAAWRCRTLAGGGTTRPPRLVLLAIAIGAATGLANLAANALIANVDPALQALLAQRMAAIGWLDAVVAAPLTEEIAVRLFLMSAVAWVVSRVTPRASVVFAIALAGSALVFALLHLSRPVPLDPSLANIYRASLVAKYTLAGLPLGWMFWRWGLPYAILCHAAANAAHLAAQAFAF